MIRYQKKFLLLFSFYSVCELPLNIDINNPWNIFTINLVETDDVYFRNALFEHYSPNNNCSNIDLMKKNDHLSRGELISNLATRFSPGYAFSVFPDHQ